MIDAPKHTNALRALHLVLCHARTMALTGEEGAKIADVLDWAELLPRFIASSEDKTSDFENALEAIANKRPELRDVVEAFGSPVPARW
jgi:hypothetical protein